MTRQSPSVRWHEEPDDLRGETCPERYTPNTYQVLDAARLLLIADQYDTELSERLDGYSNTALGVLSDLVQNWAVENITALRQWMSPFDQSEYVRECLAHYEEDYPCDPERLAEDRAEAAADDRWEASRGN